MPAPTAAKLRRTSTSTIHREVCNVPSLHLAAVTYDLTCSLLLFPRAHGTFIVLAAAQQGLKHVLCSAVD